MNKCPFSGPCQYYDLERGVCNIGEWKKISDKQEIRECKIVYMSQCPMGGCRVEFVFQKSFS